MKTLLSQINVAAVSTLCLVMASCGGGSDTQSTLSVDSTPIALEIDSPDNNVVVKASPISITGRLGQSGAKVTIGGVNATVSGSAFSADVPLVEGENSIEVVATINGRSESKFLSVILNSTEMCGFGETFVVNLPGVVMANDPSTESLPDRRLPNDKIFLPKDCKIYAFFIQGYGRNGQLDELMFYNLAKYVAENDGYAHWSWWNNFLDSYMARPLHSHPDAQSSPGDLLTDGIAFTIPDGTGKGVPHDDFQFQSDAQKVLEAVKAENPDAIIIVAGHGMGGDATARVGFYSNVDIDLLAPIDPVGNRNLPNGVGSAADYQTGLRSATPGTLAYTRGNETYNWTRWRTTREFRGFKQRDCIRNTVGLCKDFDPQPLRVEYRCTLLPESGWLEQPPLVTTIAPIECPRSATAGPVRDSGIPITFGTNIKRLYHRWQQEAFFPYDYHADDPDHEILGIRSPIKANYIFGASTARSDSIFGGNFQAPVTENEFDEDDPNKTCRNTEIRDPRRAESFDGSPLNCQDWDGHGEMIGMRASTFVSALPTNGNLQPLALKAQPFASASDSWLEIEQIFERKKNLVAMATAFDPDTGADTWPHRPVNPDLDLVVGDMVAIVEDILLSGEPGGDDVTAPSSSANPDIEANEHGWNNTDVVITISATDEQGGSGVSEISFSYSGAESGSGVVDDSSVQIAFTTEGETTIEYFATDNAGNIEESRTLVVRIDKTPPTLVANVEPEPNEHGWNNESVTVTFEASDDLSGIDTVTDPITISDDGANQEAVGEAIDKAGNSTTVGAIVNIDKTPAVITGLPENCSLWPPNHKLVEVADIIVTDELSGLVEFVVDATSSEPVSGHGYGNTEPDIVINGGNVQLRAERYSHEGRRYDIAVSAIDFAGNIVEGNAVCIVVHDQRK